MVRLGRSAGADHGADHLVAAVAGQVFAALGYSDRGAGIVALAAAPVGLQADDRRATDSPVEFDPERVESAMTVLQMGPEPPGGWANPWLIGWVHEQAVSHDERKRRGAWYTPKPVVRGLVDLARSVTRSTGSEFDFIIDPTCGGGAFLLAAADSLVNAGLSPSHALGLVGGCDVDPLAVAAGRWSLRAWAAGHNLDPAEADPDLVVADALDPLPDRWPEKRLVVGNPPFASPLRSGSMPAEAERYRQRHDSHLGHYADLAAVHLHRAVTGSADGSVVALVQPQSVIASRDTAALRSFFDDRAPMVGLWVAREAVFDAGVRACAPVLAVGAIRPSSVVLASGPAVTVTGDRRSSQSTSWAGFATQALGAPVIAPTRPGVGTLADLATATAGFRDEYYGLAEACTEWDGLPGVEPNRLVTVGSVDPLATRWGEEELRFAGKLWYRPWIDTDRLDDKTGRWWARQRRPKVVLATQSKLLEPVVDGDGRLVPCTPLVAVHSDEEDLALIAAVLLAPPVVAEAWQRWFGTALSVDALKLAASQVLELPLPDDRRAWHRAAALIDDARSGHESRTPEEGWVLAVEVAAIMNEAYRSSSEVLSWWLSRAPTGLGRLSSAPDRTGWIS